MWNCSWNLKRPYLTYQLMKWHSSGCSAHSSALQSSAGVCCKSARHWLTAVPYQLTQITNGRGDGHIWQLLRFIQTHAGANCWHCYRLRHYSRRPAQYVIRIKPARSEAMRRLVLIINAVTNSATPGAQKVYNNSTPSPIIYLYTVSQ